MRGGGVVAPSLRSLPPSLPLAPQPPMQRLTGPAHQWAKAFQLSATRVGNDASPMCPDSKNRLGQLLPLLAGAKLKAAFQGREVHASRIEPQAVERTTLREGGDDDVEQDRDPDEKPAGRRGGRKLTRVDPEDIAPEPMDYYFAGVAPDFKAPRLSDEVKDKMWREFSAAPGPEMIDKLAVEYRIRKQRVHAILWLKDIEKKEAAERGKPLPDDIENGFEQIHGAYEKADDERHFVLPSTGPDFSVQAEGWEGSTKDTQQSLNEASAREEKMLLEEFVQRMNFNKMQIAGTIRSDRSAQQRPVGGWSYLIEEMGEAGKRGRRGGRRYVAKPDGSHRGLNEIEKVFLKRETVRPRRRLTPK